MIFITYFLIYNDLNVYNSTSRSNLEYLQSFLEIDQNPEEGGFNDFDTTFEDLLNSCEYEEFFTETEEKLEEESIEVLKDNTGFLGEKYDIIEISFFLFWGFISEKLKKDEYKAFLTYYNPFIKMSKIDLFSKKKNLQIFYWFLDQSFFLEENFLNISPIYFLNNKNINFIQWSYINLYFNSKERLNCNLSPLDYFEDTFYFIPDPEIQENFFDYKTKKNLYFIFAQNNVRLPDWDDVDYYSFESDLIDSYGLIIKSHYIVFNNLYSILLSLFNNNDNKYKIKTVEILLKKKLKLNSFLQILYKCI